MTIKKIGSKYVLYSKKGKRLSKPTTKKGALKRMRAVEFFKHKGKR